MAKNIVVCCDGTGNDFSGQGTNVVKLYRALDLSDGSRQVALYDAGVGTSEEAGRRNPIARGYRKFSGLAFGRGVFKNILDGYRFLMEHYTPGDRIYLFGFSRGAFTVRGLAAMLYKVGLLRPGSSLAPCALRLFRSYPKSTDNRHEYWAEVRRFKGTFARECKTHFVGAWDTVNSIGAWGTVKSLRPMRKLGFMGGTRLNFTATNPDLLHGRHAVSIDEERVHFRTNLWNHPHSDKHQEVWFPGVHSDVGGGYEDRGLGDISLKWMLDAAEDFGLLLREDAREGLNGDSGAELHNSLIPVWWMAGWRKRQLHAYKGDWPVHVHESVYQRMKLDGGYTPDLPPGAVAVGGATSSLTEGPPGDGMEIVSVGG